MTGTARALPAGENESAEPSTRVHAEETGSLPVKTGAIEGRVLLENKTSSRQKLIIVKDRDVCGRTDHYDERLIVGKGGGVRNSVVSLTKVPVAKPLRTMGTRFVIDQKDCAYSPHVLLIPVNQELTILNSDGLLHNIHTFSSKNRPLNIAHTKLQKELKLRFTHPERVPVKCDIHGWMSAWFIIVDHPYHSVTNEEGKFSLADVPPGTYTLSCWHELLGEQTTQVTVEAGSAATVDFRYSSEKKIAGSD